MYIDGNFNLIDLRLGIGQVNSISLFLIDGWSAVEVDPNHLLSGCFIPDFYCISVLCAHLKHDLSRTPTSK